MFPFKISVVIPRYLVKKLPNIFLLKSLFIKSTSGANLGEYIGIFLRHVIIKKNNYVSQL